MAPIPPLLSLGPPGGAAPSCTECSGRPSRFSCSCCSSWGSPAWCPCRSRTTAARCPTTSPAHSTPCSDTPTGRRRSEPGGRRLQRAGPAARTARPTASRASERRARAGGCGPCVRITASEADGPRQGEQREAEGLEEALFETLSLGTKEMQSLRAPGRLASGRLGAHPGRRAPSGPFPPCAPFAERHRSVPRWHRAASQPGSAGGSGTL